jgi:hypothetical protein
MLKTGVLAGVLAGALLLAGGCGDASPGSGVLTTGPEITDTPRTSEPSDLRSPPPVTEAIATTPLYPAGDIDLGLQPFIDQAVNDLAALLGVDASDVTTHAAVLVVWPDASLGCPLPGVSYPQVLTDGSIIELEHDGVVYRYHTGGGRGPFQCPTPLAQPPAVGGNGER